MIKQSTVLMATPLAMLATEKGLNLHEKATDLIKGLNETTASVVSFTDENIATELPDYTALVPTHSEALALASDVVADTIRGALYTISKAVKPILVETQTRLKSTMDAEAPVEVIMSHINLEMINIEPAFLNSAFYPKGPALTFQDVNHIRLDELLRGVWPRLTGTELSELIALPVPELESFFNDPSELQAIYETLFIEKNFYSLFDGRAIVNGVVDIKNPLNYRFTSYRTLVIANLLLNKLASLDDPLDGVTAVSLDDYRVSLQQTRDLFTTMLYHFKMVWEQRAQAGIVVLSDDVTFGASQDSIFGNTPFIRGKVTIGYNRAVLEMFANGNELSLSEYVLGSIYAKQRGYQVKDIITDKQVVCDAWREYRSDVAVAIVAAKGPAARRAFVSVLENLHTKEEYLPLIEAMEDNIPLSQRVVQRLTKHIDLNMFFNNIQMLDAVIRGDNSLMNTQLAVLLAEVFDSPIAVEILSENARTPAGTKEQQRKNLSRSIDHVIIKRLFNL